MQVLETARLRLRHFRDDDAAFVLELVNEPGWLRYIGDKGVRTLEDARGYIRNGPVAMYATHGFGLYLVELKESGVAIGMCGLIKRDTLPDVDIGFAFLERFGRRGYGLESAAAVLSYATDVLGHARVVAITSPDNHLSAKLLEKLGFHFEKSLQLAPEGEAVRLFAFESSAAPE